MYLKSLEIAGFKSFAKKSTLDFNAQVTAIVGPNGSGKSNVAEAFRFVLGEQSLKSMRGKRGEDLIFNGSNNQTRLNRASVKVTFDNSKRVFPLEYDEVVIERVVHRDSLNEYLINGSKVRLKDIIELLAQAHIGASGHHIISQGEADRILNSSNKERKTMIEDALGLKIYQYKREESTRKLEKTEENINQVQALRKEIAPHLKFLKRQVEKVEKAFAMRDELVKLYQEYFKREELHLAHERESLNAERHGPQTELHQIEAKLTVLKGEIESETKANERPQELVRLEEVVNEIRVKKDELARSLGRLEGEISAEERQRDREIRMAKIETERLIKVGEVRTLLDHLKDAFNQAEMEGSIDRLRMIVSHMKNAVGDFVQRHIDQVVEGTHTFDESELNRLISQKGEIETELERARGEERDAQHKYQTFRAELEEKKDSLRTAERQIFELVGRQNELRAILGDLRNRDERLRLEKENFDRELRESVAIAGHGAISFNGMTFTDSVGEPLTDEELAVVPRAEQETRFKQIEKMKIRLEDAGASGGEETMKEYQDLTERDAFLEKEIADLEGSAESLKTLIKELTVQLERDFKEGMDKINTQFNEFFALMFGGGRASLTLLQEKKRRRGSIDGGALAQDPDADFEEPEEELESGIEIDIALPHKKTKGLEMLSGGERALTSIALLFAISQVNPPPFIILDETDAALDEANSKKYGNMIENLSRYSQLIVITHNRETMSTADIIYGVTMGGDGISKLLSIQFAEAVSVAK
jgi:chromosome segregation protein